MESKNGEGRVRFEEFEADPATGELFCRGERLTIQEKPFQILLLLLYANGEMVSRERIFEAVWPDVHVERNHCLNTAIRKLRTTLADDAGQPRLVETIGSRGYRLSVPVDVPAEGSAHFLPLRRPSLAVIPFQNLTAAADDYFSDGLTEQMIAQLGRMYRHIMVIAPVSAMQYKGTAKSPQQIGRELNSDYVLCGSVLRDGQRFRITARLIRARDQSCLWADSYDRNVADIFLVQEEITQSIARAILQTLPAPAGTNSHLTTSPATYEKFLMASFFAAKAVEPAFSRAAKLFQEIIAEDPEFAPAYASLAVMYIQAGQYGPLPPDVTYARVQALCSTALGLCHDLPEIHTALGLTKMFYHADFPAAEVDFRCACEINPSSSYACLGYSFIMTVLGRHEEALTAMRRARELDPLSPSIGVMLACALYFAGQSNEGLDCVRQVIELHPNFPPAYATAGWILSFLGDHEAALHAYHTAVRYCPESPIMAVHLAYGLAAAGHAAEVQAVVQQVLESRRTGWVSSYCFALVYIALGETDEAFHWLEIAVQERDGWRVLSGTDPRLALLASHPRLHELLQRAGLRAPTIGL